MNSGLKQFGFFCILLLAFFRSISLAEEIPSPVNINPIARTFFGINAHRLDVGTPWPTAEVGSLRTWDAKVRWADLQPAPDTWNFSRLDILVNGAAQRKIEVLVPLGMPAAWASSRPQEPSAYGLGEAAPPARLEDWERYVRTVATRYKGRVTAYEIWNEPNLPRFFSGSPQELVRLTCAAQRTIKLVDPNAIIVSPAALGDYGVVWLDKFLAAGGGNCFDVLGYHFYNKHKDPETHIVIFKSIRDTEHKYGSATKPIWNTEAGWLIESVQQKIDARVAGFENGARVLTRKEAPAIVARTFILHAAMGTERFYWYALDNDAMGLLERSGAAKPAWRSYVQTANLLTNRMVKRCISNDSVWSCSINEGDRTVAIAMWVTGLNVSAWRLPAGVVSSEVLGQGTVTLNESETAGMSGDVVIYWLR